MRNPTAVAKWIAELHNEGVRTSGEVVRLPVNKASTIAEEVIRLTEDAIEDASVRTTKETLELHHKADVYFDLHELVRASSP